MVANGCCCAARERLSHLQTATAAAALLLSPKTRLRFHLQVCFPVNRIIQKKALGETQTLRAGCSKAEPKIFSPPQTPFPGAQDGQNLISWRWSLPAPTKPVWWGSMHAISSYRGNRATNKQTHTHKQIGPITIHCAAKLSAQCNYFVKCRGMVGHNPETNRLDFGWPWPKVRVTMGQKVIIVFANNSVQNCRVSRQNFLAYSLL